MAFKLSLNQESVEVLYYLADKLPVTVESLNEATVKLLEIYNSLSDDLGVHRNDFQIMLLKTQKTLLLANDSFSYAELVLRNAAERIDEYLNSTNGTSDTDSPKIKTLNRGHFDD